jgi:hypothetical protein
MSQNTSSAVMAQRVEAHDSLDFFPTPPWATRALCEHVIIPTPRGGRVAPIAWDPAAGDGAMVKPLTEYFSRVEASDVHDYGQEYAVHDFLMPFLPRGIASPDWIVVNPPFRLAEQFIWRALAISAVGVAVIVRSVFAEGIGRYERLFNARPPSIIAQFTERVVMHKGRLSQDGSTATAYCWMVWRVDRVAKETRFAWIPPCRKALERASDYPEAA